MVHVSEEHCRVRTCSLLAFSAPKKWEGMQLSIFSPLCYSSEQPWIEFKWACVVLDILYIYKKTAQERIILEKKHLKKQKQHCSPSRGAAPFFYFALMSPQCFPSHHLCSALGLHSCCTHAALGLLCCEPVRAKSKVFPLLHPFPGRGRCGACSAHFFQKYRRSSIRESLAVCNTLLLA